MNWEFDENMMYLEKFEYDYEDWAQVRGGLHGRGVLCELGAPVYLVPNMFIYHYVTLEFVST